MKTITLCLLLSASLVSCQDEASIDTAKENIWKRNTDKRQESLDRNQNNGDDPTNARRCWNLTGNWNGLWRKAHSKAAQSCTFATTISLALQVRRRIHLCL